MKVTWVINSYHGNTDWIHEYTDDVVFYDKKDLNVGSNIYDYMYYIVDNYENLPDAVLFGKSNMLERHLSKEDLDDTLLMTFGVFDVFYADGIVPLMTQEHETKLGVSFYKDDMYYEINNSWYAQDHPHKYYSNYNDFARDFDLPAPGYLGFAPGACWIVPRENILKHPKDYYQRLKDIVSYDANPAEAHMIERALYYIWQ